MYKICFSVFLLSAMLSIAVGAQAQPQITNLKCEYLINPLGVDAINPRFTWQMADAQRGARQLGYELAVSKDSLAFTKAVIWRTIAGASSNNLVTYKGVALQPFTKYFWRVLVKNDRGTTLTSPIASFETGMLNSSNWQGTWISDANSIKVKQAPYFRKKFTTNKTIRSARAYIASGGLYELYLNGSKVGNHRLDPVYTRYDRRNVYVTYDVTKHLQRGDNAVGVLLGNGWYNHQSTAVWDFERAPWRARPTFCLDLRITYTDGTVETISSQKGWKTSTGPLIFNSIYTAEHYDARLEQPGWNTTTFDDSKWKNVVNRSAPSGNIVSQMIPPIRNVQEIKPVSAKKINDTTYVFDLGRNISGVTKLSVTGKEGTVFRLKHSERLKANGMADMSNIDVHYRPTDDTDPFQTDIYILSGKGKEQFMPLFNYKGFQYIEVTVSTPITLSTDNLTGYFMHTDVPIAGNIQSANPTLNKLWAATNNSYLSNLFGYPTDCPQREKNGWTGDAHIAIETGLYNFDGITVYEKWMADHRDEQQPNGVLPSIVPTGGWGYEWGNGPDWTSTITIIPWNIYLFYGDTRILSDNYDNMKRYVDHITTRSPNGLTDWGLGDWVPVKSKAPKELTSSAYYYTNAVILGKIATILGKSADKAKYEALATKIKDAFNAKYLSADGDTYGSGLQTELAVPLFWGLVPEASKAKVAATLAKRVAADNWHLDVGLLGTKAILNALSENGYPEVAYRVAAQETFPSWGWWIVNGATTLYENWPIDATSDISRNHIMFGEIGAWLFKAPGGIFPDEKAPGFKHILLKPHFETSLAHFEAAHESRYGRILSSWKRNKEIINYKIIIPANATATLQLPNKLKVTENEKIVVGKIFGNSNLYQLTAGTYNFAINNN